MEKFGEAKETPYLKNRERGFHDAFDDLTVQTGFLLLLLLSPHLGMLVRAALCMIQEWAKRQLHSQITQPTTVRPPL